MLDSYQWDSNSAPLCKRKANERRGTRKEEHGRTRRDGEKENKKMRDERERTRREHTVIKCRITTSTVTLNLSPNLDFKARFSTGQHNIK